jgi:two-component system, NtrC family, nitrogen regulation response regulator GlnG
MLSSGITDGVRKILVADGDAALRRTLSEALSQVGYVAQPAATGATLWNCVRRGDGDLIVSGLVLPDDTAGELLLRIRKLRPKLPIIVLATADFNLSDDDVQEIRPYQLLHMPYDLRALINAVERVLAPPKI